MCENLYSLLSGVVHIRRATEGDMPYRLCEEHRIDVARRTVALIDAANVEL